MKKKKQAKFVIQQHERQDEPTHWDLMLEKSDVLETYRVNKPPEEWGKGLIEAVKIFNHPLKFLTYQGSVNNGKGNVTIADSGVYRLLTENENKLTVDFEGVIVKGIKEIIFSGGKYRAQHE